MSSDRFNRSRIATVIVAAVTSNLRLADAPGNVSLTAQDTGLSKPSVVNVRQLMVIDRRILDSCIGPVPSAALPAVDAGLRLLLGL